MHMGPVMVVQCLELRCLIMARKVDCFRDRELDMILIL